jgi:hypothetical protein
MKTFPDAIRTKWVEQKTGSKRERERERQGFFFHCTKCQDNANTHKPYAVNVFTLFIFISTPICTIYTVINMEFIRLQFHLHIRIFWTFTLSLHLSLISNMFTFSLSLIVIIICPLNTTLQLPFLYFYNVNKYRK